MVGCTASSIGGGFVVLSFLFLLLLLLFFLWRVRHQFSLSLSATNLVLRVGIGLYGVCTLHSSLILNSTAQYGGGCAGKKNHAIC